MVGTTCPQCERAVPTDTIRADAVFCPFCGWQGKYKPPVEEHSAVLAPGKTNLPETPVEEVFFTLRESIPRYIGSVIVMNTLLSAMVGGIAILVFLSIALAQHMPLFAVPVCAVMMFGIAWAFTSILTIPVMPYFTLFHRARRFEVKGTLLHVQTGRKQRTYDLSGHAWQRCGKVPMDTYGSYFRTRPRLKVVLNRHEYGLGFTEEAAAEWTRYFEAVGLKEESPVRWRPILAYCVLASFVGGAVGAIVEPLFALPKERQGTVIFTGFLDGLLIGMVCRIPGSREQVGRYRWAFVAAMAVIFAGIALKATGILGWQVYSLNALIGAVIAWFLRRDEKATGRLSG